MLAKRWDVLNLAVSLKGWLQPRSPSKITSLCMGYCRVWLEFKNNCKVVNNLCAGRKNSSPPIDEFQCHPTHEFCLALDGWKNSYLVISGLRPRWGTDLDELGRLPPAGTAVIQRKHINSSFWRGGLNSFFFQSCCPPDGCFCCLRQNALFSFFSFRFGFCCVFSPVFKLPVTSSSLTLRDMLCFRFTDRTWLFLVSLDFLASLLRWLLSWALSTRIVAPLDSYST